MCIYIYIYIHVYIYIYIYTYCYDSVAVLVEEAVLVDVQIVEVLVLDCAKDLWGTKGVQRNGVRK